MTAPTMAKKALASALAAPEPLPAGNIGPAAVRRLRLWELDDKHHCPVIGSCLPVDELVRLARRFFAWIDLGNAFAMHVEVVNQARTRNPLSEAMQNILERRYQLEVNRFKQLKSDGDIMLAWRQHYARGDVAGALWAAITHRMASTETRHVIFADVHMLSHQIGAGLASDARRLAALESECAAAKAALERQKKSQAESEAALRRQVQSARQDGLRLPALSDELARLRQRLSAFESGLVMVDIGHRLLTLQAENSKLLVGAQRAWTLEKNLQAAHQEAQALARERDQLSAERNALARLLSVGEDEFNEFSEFDAFDAFDAPARPDDCGGECARCDQATAGQCVLYVGGRSALLAQYRALAARLGIRLLHHDGGREESLARLPEMISGADAVLCPTDCVSHSAYYQLKRQCKRSGKPCLLFKGAGISGLAGALARLASGQFSLPAMSGEGA